MTKYQHRLVLLYGFISRRIFSVRLLHDLTTTTDEITKRRDESRTEIRIMA